MTSKLPRMPNNDTELDSLTSQAFFPHRDLRIPKVEMHAYQPSQCCLRTKSFVKKRQHYDVRSTITSVACKTDSFIPRLIQTNLAQFANQCVSSWMMEINEFFAQQLDMTCKTM